MKNQRFSLKVEATKHLCLVCLFALFTPCMATAQHTRWPVQVYGGKGSLYGSAPVISGYLLTNSKNLKGLVHRTYLRGSSFDTLSASDTLPGRIKLCILSSHIDIEVSKSNVLSVPCSYIESIVGTSFGGDNRGPSTRWIILSPKMDYPFRRLVGQKNGVFIYDSSLKDTVYHDYSCPMIINNGFEKIEISGALFTSTRASLKKFIKKRYGMDVTLPKEEAAVIDRFLISYILQQENMLLDKKRKRNDLKGEQ